MANSEAYEYLSACSLDDRTHATDSRQRALEKILPPRMFRTVRRSSTTHRLE